MSHPERTMRVLLVSDSASESLPLIHELERLAHKLIIKKISNKEELFYQLNHYNWNLVISEYQTRQLSALESLDIVRHHSADLPFLLLTDCIGEEVVADMMKAGVEDVVLKSRLERLYPVVKRILREHETKDKEARAQKIANEAFAAKEQMLAIVSHDIKNPISAIQLEAQMLLRASERAGKSILAEEVRIQANRILKTVDRMKILISDLLDKNKSENGLSHLVKHNINVTRLIQDVLDYLRPLTQEKNIIIRTSLSVGIQLQIDRNKMFQVFSNLINNAIKFSPSGGTIQILMEQNDHEFVFSIDDSGPGLSDMDINNVFEKYWSGSASQFSGTGLGLFICKTIVEAHGGRIFVENISSGGARFKFSIPRDVPSLQIYSSSIADARNDQRKKIYIVDDDEDLREVISWALSKEGYSIHSFKSPGEALQNLLKESHTPDLIVVDFHMDEMKGSEFIFRKNHISSAKNCPVVMISASPQEVEKEVPREFYEEIITKPIDLEGLVNNVKKLL